VTQELQLKDLLSGIGVVIDEKINSTTSNDTISSAIEWIEKSWNLPFCRLEEYPTDTMWPQLLKGASFIILDWKLWDTTAGGSTMERQVIGQHKKFLEEAKKYFVPVVIFTNEDRADVIDKLLGIYRDGEENNFVFIKKKSDDLGEWNDLEEWMRKSASVYTLKSWEQSFSKAKCELFGSMYARSPDWPKVFWNGYKEDGVDPGSSLIDLLNQNLIGRMPSTEFKEEIFESESTTTGKEELKQLINEASLRSKDALVRNEIRCGDLFKLPKQKYLLNLRPDCDCIPRDGNQNIDDVELYCVEGEAITDSRVSKNFKHGQLIETISEGIVFSVDEGKSVRFDFKKLRIKKYGCLKDKRVGQLLHPYITRIQQRYALYLQRQGLPRIPSAAISSQ